MEEKKNNTNLKGDNTPLIYITLIFMGMILIGYLSIYSPILIFSLLFLTPIALKYDMDTSKPILSIGLVAICGLFLYLNQFNYSIYWILVVSTGLSVLINFIIWRFLRIERFSDGIKYSILSSVCIGVLTALVVFLLSGKQPFALQIINDIEKWIFASKSEMVNQYLDSMYIYVTLPDGNQTANITELTRAMLGLSNITEGISKADKLDKLMPYIEFTVNRYSIFAIVLYPMFAGIITWWRGNYRYYKNSSMSEEIKDLKPKPFSTFTIPRWLFGTTVLVLIISLAIQTSNSSDVMLYAGSIMQNFAYILLALQGLAIIEYFLKRVKIFRNVGLRLALIIIITILSSGVFLLLVGGADLFINIRAVYAKVDEAKKKVKKDNLHNKNDNIRNNDKK